MHDDLNQKISQFLDDELPHEEAANLLQKMQTHSGLVDKMHRYQAISHAIKNDELSVMARLDFVTSVSSRIQQEPAYLIPNAARRLARPRRFTRSHKFAAAAASVAVIAFVAHTQRPAPVANLPIASAKAPVKQLANPANAMTSRNAYPVNQQINDYLQAHNGSTYTNGQADFQPYAQVTHYSQK